MEVKSFLDLRFSRDHNYKESSVLQDSKVWMYTISEKKRERGEKAKKKYQVKQREIIWYNIHRGFREVRQKAYRDKRQTDISQMRSKLRF